jgi:hypothetical protein
MPEGIEVAISRMRELPLYNKLNTAEKSLHDALCDVAKKHGKFGAGKSASIYPNYESPSENDDSAIGVKCGNCSFFVGEGNCKIVAQKVEANGKCRFAAIPDGYVKMDKEEDDEEEDD